MKKRYLLPLCGVATLAVAALSYSLYARAPALPSTYLLQADHILTMETNSASAEAILVTDGIITQVGSYDALRANSDAKEISLTGTLTPGLIEPHTHPIAAALLGASVDISAFTFTNRNDIMDALRAASEKPALTPWLIAYGWDPVALPDLTPPTRAELDAISPDRPLLILTQMLHDAYVNTAAVEAAGLTLEGSLLHETDAVNSAVNKIPPPSAAISETLIRQQYARYARAGFTTIGVAGAIGRHQDPVGILRKISSDKHSALRTFVYLIDDQHTQNPLGGDLNFAVQGTKFWLDGSPFTGGAALAEPYADTPFVTQHLNISAARLPAVFHDKTALLAALQPLHRANQQIALHVQGERAVQVALDTIAALQHTDPRPDLHHRLEHNALITKAQIARAADLGVSLGFFVDHISYYGHVLPSLLGAARAARYMPVGDAVRSGAIVTLHGDHPATPINAVQTLAAATTRLSADGRTHTAPDQAISGKEALAAMTRNAAHQLGQAQDLGTIAVGKQADFTLWSDDPTAQNHDTLTVLKTYKAGQPVDHRMVSWLRPSLVWKALMGMI